MLKKYFPGDHALVDLGCIGHFNPKLITVRSKSRDLLSIDSSAVPIQGSTKLKKQVYSKKYDDGSLVNQLGEGFDIETVSAAMSFKNSHKKLSTRLLLV